MPDARYFNRPVPLPIQTVAMDQVPVYPLGQYFQPTAYRTDISNVSCGLATFWNVRCGA